MLKCKDCTPNGQRGVAGLQTPTADAFLPLDELRGIEIFEAALKDGKGKVFRVRVQVVGHHGVGKTSLVHRLLEQPLASKETVSTEGVELHIQCCKMSTRTGRWLFDKTGGNDDAEFLANVIRGYEPKPNRKRQLSPLQSATEESKRTKTLKRTRPATRQLQKEVEEYSRRSMYDDPDESFLADVSILDFAGQFVFYSTHQTFMTAEALYILVLDLSKMDMKKLIEDDVVFLDVHGNKQCKIKDLFEFWLSAIHMYVGRSKAGYPKVLLVGTKKDKVNLENRDTLINAFFTSVRERLKDTPLEDHLVDGYVAVDNTLDDDSGVDIIRQKIYKIASEQENWGREIPARWIPLYRELNAKKKQTKVVSFADIQEINSNLDVPIPSDDELEVFLHFHHECGDLLYFEDENLKESILLDPEFLVKALTTIVTAEQFASKREKCRKEWRKLKESGIMTRKLIDLAWDDPEGFFNYTSHLLKLMEKLNFLATEIPNTMTKADFVGQIFVPCMVEKIAPNDVINKPDTEDVRSSTSLCLVSRKKFLPSAVVHRLIAACIGKWKIAEGAEKNIYCSCCVFHLDHCHSLTVLLADYAIEIFVTKYGKIDPCPKLDLCIDARTFITENVKRILDVIGLSPLLEVCVKCPDAERGRNDGYNLVTDLSKWPELRCQHTGQKHKFCNGHGITSSELLRHWFLPQDYQAEADMPTAEVPSALPIENLDEHPSDRQLSRVARNIGKEFQQLGLELGVEEATIEQIQIAHKYVPDQTFHILTEWRKRNGDNATFRQLEQAMRSVDIDTSILKKAF